MLVFDQTFGLWPRAGFAWMHYSIDQGDYEAGGDLYELTVEAPLVISPMKHFAILIGPYADIGLGGRETEEGYDLWYNSFGLSSSIVGYFP